MTEKSTVTETSAGSRSPRLPQLLGRLGLYATYVAAALILLVVAGDLDVLVGRARLVGRLALLVAAGPLVAMLLSIFASYVNYYGVWRILRGKDEYDAGQDLKSHVTDAPQALETMLAGRAGCLPAASTVLLFVSLLLALAASVPPTTPGVGALGTWNVPPIAHAAPATPSAAVPTDTPTALPTATATATPRPTATPTPTPIPVVIRFSVSPTTASWSGCLNGSPPPAKTLTLDNSGSNVSVSWNASTADKVLTGELWAVITPASGRVSAHGKQTITVNPDPASNPPGIEVCNSSAFGSGTPWHVKVATNRAGTFTFTDTVFGAG